MNGLNLLVTMTDKSGSFGRTPLTAACRGHNDMGTVLNYFLYEASKEAKKKGIDKENVEFIEIERSQKDIIDELHGAVKSKKTLTFYSRKFQEWEFVDGDPYHHIYRVYFKNIQRAVDNPPPADPSKPRGIHAKKAKDEPNDTNGKNTICTDGKNSPDERDEKIAFLEGEVVNLRSEMAKMRFEMPKMIFQMLNLPFPQSSEESSEAALSSVTEPLDSLRVIKSNKEYVPIGTADQTTELLSQEINQEIIDANSTPLTSSTRSSDTNIDGIHDTHPNGSDKPTSPNVGNSPNKGKVEPTSRTNDAELHIARLTTRNRRSKKKTGNTEPLSQKPLPELVKQEPNLSEKAREVWNIWLKMPWNKIAPKLTDTAAKHCEDLAKVEFTEEILWKVINYARKNDKNGFYDGRAIQLGDIVREYSKWSNMHHTQADQSKSSKSSQHGTSSALSFSPEELRRIGRVPQDERKAYIENLREEKAKRETAAASA